MNKGKHLMVDGVMISVDLTNIVVVATKLTIDHGLWMAQLRYDRSSRRFYLAQGKPEVKLPVPGVATCALVELGDDARHLVCSRRFAYRFASECGVTVETVNEVTAERPPSFDGDFNPYADSEDFNPYADSEDFNPYADSEDFNPYADSEDFNPYADSEDFNPYADSEDGPTPHVVR